MAKFFSAAAVWGRLLLRDVPDLGPWDPQHVVYWDEIYLDSVSRLALSGQKIRAVAELDDAIAASRRPPGIRPLWIHEDLLDDAHRRWDEAREPQTAAEPVNSPEIAMPVPVTRRWRAIAAVAAAVAAAFLVGFVAGGWGPGHSLPLSVPLNGAAQVGVMPATSPALALKDRSPRVARSLAAPTTAAGASQTVGARPRPAYTVRVATFQSRTAAERLRHLVLSKGYVVIVLREGAASKVVTPPYQTRAQAERIGRGLAGCGIPGQVTTWRAL